MRPFRFLLSRTALSRMTQNDLKHCDPHRSRPEPPGSAAVLIAEEGDRSVLVVSRALVNASVAQQRSDCTDNLQTLVCV